MTRKDSPLFIETDDDWNVYAVWSDGERQKIAEFR